MNSSAYSIQIMVHGDLIVSTLLIAVPKDHEVIAFARPPLFSRFVHSTGAFPRGARNVYSSPRRSYTRCQKRGSSGLMLLQKSPNDEAVSIAAMRWSSNF